MGKLQFSGKWVLVTGASSGLGQELARQLAQKHQANLILLARRKEKLEQLKAEVEGHVKVKVIAADHDTLRVMEGWRPSGFEFMVEQPICNDLSGGTAMPVATSSACSLSAIS